MTVVIVLMLIQGALGALDTLWHHELEVGLPGKPHARSELLLHAAREAIYALVFLTLAWTTWDGLFATLLAGLLLVEIGITLADFVLEDRTRKLPPSERVLHTVMAIGFGLILARLAPELWIWAQRPTGFTAVSYGWLSWVMTAVGVGVAAWAVRDGLAAAGPAPAPAAIGRRSGRTVLITGATGFIGKALVADRLRRGDRVLALSRDAVAARLQFGPAVTVVENLDLLPAETRIDIVVNLAGASVAGGPWTPARRRQLLGGRLTTTRAVVRLADRLERRPAVLISASAVGFYGDRGEERLAETAGPAPGFMSALCQAWEAEARKAEPLGVRVCRLRLGLVLDWSGGLLPVLALPARFGLGAVPGDGRSWAPWIALEDVIGVIDAAIVDSRYEGAINGVAPDRVTQGELTRSVAWALRRPQFLAVPGWLLKAGLGEMSDLLLASQKVEPARLVQLDFGFVRPTLPQVLLPDETPQAEAPAKASSPAPTFR